MDFDTILMKKHLRNNFENIYVGGYFDLRSVDKSEDLSSTIKNIDKENLIIELENGIKIRFQ